MESGDLENDGEVGIGSYRDDTLTDRIIWCIIQVHQTLGAGFLERVYRRALIIELRKQGLVTRVEQEIDVYYDGQLVGKHRLDLIVEARSFSSSRLWSV